MNDSRWRIALACIPPTLLPLAVFVPSEGAIVAGSNALLVMLWLLGLVVWAASGIARARLPFRWNAFDSLVAGVFGWIAVAGIAGAWTGQPRHGVNGLFEWLALAATYLLVRQTIRSALEARALVAVMIAVAAGLASVGVVQVGVTFPAQRARFQEDPEAVIREMGVNAPPGTPQRQHVKERIASPEPLATFALTNSLAGFLAPWAILLTAIFMLTMTQPSRWQLRVGLGILLALLLFILALTRSRTAWIASGLGLAALAVFGLPDLAWRRRAALAVGAGGALLAIGLAIGAALGWSPIDAAWRSVVVRLEYWQSSLTMMADYRLLGVGPGQFQDYYTQYQLPTATETVADPHNLLVEVGAVAGIPALLAAAGIVAFTMFRAFHPITRMPEEITGPAADMEAPPTSHAPAARFWMYGGLAAAVLLAPLVAAVAGHPLEFAGPLPWLWIVGLPVMAVSLYLLESWVRTGPLPAGWLYLAAAALVVNLLAAGGISYQSVAGSLWALVALGENTAPAEDTETERADFQEISLRPALLGLLLATALPAAAAYFFLYEPVTTARGSLHVARDGLSLALVRDRELPEDTVTAAREAVAADSWDPDAWLTLRQALRTEWLASDSPRPPDELEQTEERLLALAGHLSDIRVSLANGHLLIYRRTEDREHLERAVEHAAAAVALFPTEPLRRAQWAYLLSVADQPEAAQREARRALELEKLNREPARSLAARQLTDYWFDEPPRSLTALREMQRLAEPAAK